MKKMYVTFLLAIFFLAANAQERKSSLATVEKVSGIPVFIYSTPVNDYDIVGKAVSAKHILMAAIDESSTIRQKATMLVEKAIERKGNGKNKDFDAVIIDLNNDKMHIIKFKGELSLKAKVIEENGIPVYLFSVPVDEYQTVTKLPPDMSLYAKRGFLIDKIVSMTNRLLKKEEKGEVEAFDAVIINPDDLSMTLIKFEK